MKHTASQSAQSFSLLLHGGENNYLPIRRIFDYRMIKKVTKQKKNILHHYFLPEAELEQQVCVSRSVTDPQHLAALSTSCLLLLLLLFNQAGHGG